MKTKTLALISLILTLVYIAALKLIALNDLDYSNIFESIRPLIPHALALIVAFVLNVLAYTKGDTMLISFAGIFCLIASMSYLPFSLLMIIPTAVLSYAVNQLMKKPS